MYNKHTLLFLIILVYIIPIIMVYIQSKENTNSVSSIICNQNIIFYLFIILFCFLCIIYEINRNDIMSCCYVVIIIIGICGVIFTKEGTVIHNIIASIVFITIICFMTHHSNDSELLQFLLFIQIVIIIIVAKEHYENKKIFGNESLLIINFAIFYIYLHFIE